MPVEQYLQYLFSEKRYSEHTIKSYQIDLDGFRAWCESHACEDLVKVSSKLVRRWVADLSISDLKAKTVNRKLSAVRGFYRYLQRQGEVEANPADKIPLLKAEKPLPVFVENRAIEELFGMIEFENDFEGVRDRLILEMFYATGIRLSELVALNVNDVDCRGEKIVVEGKRKKQRIVPLTSNVIASINGYLLKRKGLFPQTDRLFLTKKAKPVYKELVYRVVNRYLSLVSKQAKLSPHVLRHTFATHLLNQGAELNAVKELLGHASLSATQVYTHNTFEKLKNAYNKAHPRT